MKTPISKLLFFGTIIVTLGFYSCASAPSDEIIQTAIAKTELVSTLTPMATATPLFTNTPAETLTPAQDNSKQQLISEVIPLFDIGTSESYRDASSKLAQFQYLNQKNWNDEEIQTLLYYAEAMENDPAGNTLLATYQYISPNYNGVYHEQIILEVLKYTNKYEWEQQYEENHPFMETANATFGWPIGRLLPAIGMTAQQVLDSQWGQPIKKNKTITANSVSEQWVYGDGKYIYLDNGVVVSIQE